MAFNERPEKLSREEERILDQFNDPYRARPYRPVFDAPTDLTPRRVEGLFTDSYYRSARLLLEAVLDGKIPEAEGVAAVFLCRHYSELALKYALFHSRWLKEERTNATDKDVQAVDKGHRLKAPWDTLKEEVQKRAPSLRSQGLDLDFVDRFVEEFDEIDPSGSSFRYETVRIEVRPPTSTMPPVGIDFAALLHNLDHAYNVLSALDSYLVESYGENQEWESIQSAF
ncbi:MAG: hypothetical protein WBL70_08855 [Candidatus Acidiferrales bacterium]